MTTHILKRTYTHPTPTCQGHIPHSQSHSIMDDVTFLFSYLQTSVSPLHAGSEGQQRTTDKASTSLPTHTGMLQEVEHNEVAQKKIKHGSKRQGSLTLTPEPINRSLRTAPSQTYTVPSTSPRGVSREGSKSAKSVSLPTESGKKGLSMRMCKCKN